MTLTQQYEMELLQQYLEKATNILGNKIFCDTCDISYVQLLQLECIYESDIKTIENLLQKMVELRKILDNIVDTEVDSLKKKNLEILQRGNCENDKTGYIEAMINAENILIKAKINKEHMERKRLLFQDDSIRCPSTDSLNPSLKLENFKINNSKSPEPFEKNLDISTNDETSYSLISECSNSEVQNVINKNISKITNIVTRKYDETFYKNIILSIVADIPGHFQLTISYLSKNYPELLTKLNRDIVEKLYVQLSLTRVHDYFQSKKGIIINGNFCRDSLNFKDFEKDIIIQTNEKSISYSNEIRKEKTKVLITTNCSNSEWLLCVIIDYGLNYLVLRSRGTSRTTNTIKDWKNFKVTMFPNVEQSKHRRRGIESIANNEAMLVKLCVLSKIRKSPNVNILHSNGREGSGFIRIIYNIQLNNDNPILVCAPSNSDLEEIFLRYLETTRTKNLAFPFIRIVTFHIECREDLKEHTKKLCDIEDLSAYSLIFCTLGIAPKLASKFSSPKNYFSHIFIDHAKAVSELDAWMVIGNLSNENTNIFICSKPQDNGVITDVGILKEETIGYCFSIFDRLSNIQAANEKIENFKLSNVKIKKIIFEL